MVLLRFEFRLQMKLNKTKERLKHRNEITKPKDIVFHFLTIPITYQNRIEQNTYVRSFKLFNKFHNIRFCGAGLI